MEAKMAEELEKREVEEKAKGFLNKYREICDEFGLEFSVESPKFVIIQKQNVEKRDTSNN